MEWEVTCKFDSLQSTYTLAATRYYEARTKGLTLFLSEHKIPGRPWEFLTTKKGLIEVSARSLMDRRKLERKPYLKDFYVEQVENLRKLVRKGDLGDSVKRKSTKLLLELREVLSG